MTSILESKRSFRCLRMFRSRDHRSSAGHLDDFEPRFRPPRDLLRNGLPLDAFAMLERQHDGADHRDEQDKSSTFEEEDVLRVNNLAQSLRVGNAGARGRYRRSG